LTKGTFEAVRGVPTIADFDRLMSGKG
jgi:hypothetical protein